MNPKRIEEYRFFPFLAWFLVLCFAAYTIHLSIELGKAFDRIEVYGAQQMLPPTH